tara:strand:- start:180 stop:1814 length:1635 start_codon:yes stop_codon:yes gene_type:complete
MPSQPFALACEGGLDKSSSSFELLRRPGAATRLRNFEVDVAGGYRRVNGFTVFGGSSVAKPNSDNTVLGLHVYADGVIACSGTNIYFSIDGESWLQINRDSVAGGGDNYTAFTGRSTLTRTSQDKAHFSTYEGDTTYGEVIITDEGSGVKPFYFKMTGSGALSNRTYFAKEITVSGSVYPKFCTIHDKHLVVGGAATAPNTIYYSGTSDIDSFTGTGAGSIVLDDQVVGLKSFRNDLIIFCKNSIYKLTNINSSTTIAVEPITQNIGCLDGKSIQEIGGDLVFLAPDGIRTLAGTVRIGDVELGTVSRAIQPIMKGIADNIGSYNISSVVIRDKSQYRLYYGTSSSGTSAEGIIGTLKTDSQGLTQFQWSETFGIDASASAASGFNSDGVEKHYHGDYSGYVYNHDIGNSFNSAEVATSINAEYQTPDLDYGDLGTLKTLKYVKVSVTPEGDIDTNFKIRYDFEAADIPQPSDYSLSVSKPSLFANATFGTAGGYTFGAPTDPITRQTVEGSGYSNYFRIFSNNTNDSYTINGIYIDYVPSGRQ